VKCLHGEHSLVRLMVKVLWKLVGIWWSCGQE